MLPKEIILVLFFFFLVFKSDYATFQSSLLPSKSLQIEAKTPCSGETLALIISIRSKNKNKKLHIKTTNNPLKMGHGT